MINALRRLNLIPPTWGLPSEYKKFCAEVSTLDGFAGNYLLERAPHLRLFTPVCDLPKAFLWDDAVGGRDYWGRVNARLLAYRYMESVIMIANPDSNRQLSVMCRYQDSLESLTEVIVQYYNSPDSYAVKGLLIAAMDEVKKQLERG